MEPKVIKQTKEVANKCDFCHAEEGNPRPVGNYIVELQTIEVAGEEKQVCQSCIHKHPAILHSSKKGRQGKARFYRNHTGLSYLKKVVFWMLSLVVMLLLFSGELLSQPPGLPPIPDQAPIDGGLSLLAAAGGAYAINKLREKNRMRSNTND